MPDHALLSASGAHRWLHCTPSAVLESRFPSKSTVYTEEGTLAHSVAEAWARRKLGEKVTMSTFSKNDLFTAEMAECGKAYGAFVAETLKTHQETCPDAFVELETKLDFSMWVPDGFGTGDCIIVSDDILEIIDYKYGKGVRVSAEDNPQMKLYALGAYALYGSIYDIQKVRMTIFQPRLSDSPDSSEVSVEELLAWADEVVRPQAELAFKGAGDFNPSESACRFCKAKETCRARAKKFTDLFDEAQDPLLLTVDEVGALLEQAKDMKAWLSDLENLVTSTLLEGKPVEGWKLVEGRSVRRIKDEEAAESAFLNAGIAPAMLYEKKMIPLTQMEKDFGKKTVADILGDLIEKPQEKPTLAPASDKRPALLREEDILRAFDE